jgi:hypothetical protein
MSHPARIRCGAQPRARSPRPPWPEGTWVLRLAAWSGFEADWDQHLVSGLLGVRRVGPTTDRAGESCANVVAILRLLWTGMVAVSVDLDKSR